MDLRSILNHLTMKKMISKYHWTATIDNMDHIEQKAQQCQNTTPGKGVGSYAIRLSLPAKVWRK